MQQKRKYSLNSSSIDSDAESESSGDGYVDVSIGNGRRDNQDLSRQDLLHNTT